jgi:hypothetical protein
MQSCVKKWIVVMAGLLIGTGAAVGCKQPTEPAPVATPSAPKPGVAVNPAAVQQKAGAKPPAKATKTKTAGKTAVKLSTANSATDDDSFWIEQMDIDGDGNVEDSNLVWDDEDKILFTYEDGTFTCKNGATGMGEMLIAVNAEGNPRNRPVGSGFWIAALDEGECAAQAAAIWGCRFDAAGNETACGVATIDEANDDIVIVTAQE